MPGQEAGATIAPNTNNDKHPRFDVLDDDADIASLSEWPLFQDALVWLNGHIGRPYAEADAAAMQYQTRHRRFGRTAIVAGTAAIVLAVVQLALKLSWPDMVHATGLLEAAAVLAGLISVSLGLWSKYDHQWLTYRHRAERLRMLKFQSLGWPELWAGDMHAWRAMVQSQLEQINNSHHFTDIEKWCHGGRVEDDPPALTHEVKPSLASAIADYYLSKRVDYQADYFKNQSKRHERQVGILRHFGLPLFFTSVICVLIHFGADHQAGSLIDAGESEAAEVWERLAVWALALAAALPVLGVGIRTWTTALEHARSASLFAAKNRALLHEHKHIEQHKSDFNAIMHRIAHIEHFLENEHREWLRLLLDAEWFL